MREVTHYQGHAQRRSARNTPVREVLMDLDLPPVLAGQRALARRAVARCGRIARQTSAVRFHDGLSPMCCNPPITLFVARGRDAWFVFRG
jgi:hypothetical protein